MIKISWPEVKRLLQVESQDDRPSPEIPQESRANLRVPARVCDVESGAVCSKNSTFGYFDETAWTLVMATGNS